MKNGEVGNKKYGVNVLREGRIGKINIKEECELL